MKQLRKISRRSFLGSVAGGAMVGVASFADIKEAQAAGQSCTDSDPSPPRGDPGGRGRRCRSTPTPTPSPTQPSSRCSDSDPTDPVGRGRRCTPTPTPPPTGCSDSDPTDPGGRGRACGGSVGAQPTGRRERRYEVCWVDHPSRSNDDCNMQTYSEWATTYSDGRTVYDTAESERRRAEMTARGYTARWHRMIVNW
jgi:hypothetical protein